MRFEDRGDVGRRCDRRRQQYKDRLRKDAFHPRSDVYRYFVGDVFHDGQVTIHRVSLDNGEVDLILRNILIMDRVFGLGRLSHKDVSTLVRFRNVTGMSIRPAKGEGASLYYQADLARRRDGMSLTIWLQRRLRGQVDGYVAIEFSHIEVENIRPRLLRALGVRSLPRLA